MMLFVELDKFSREYVINLSLMLICLLREVRRLFIPPMQVSNLIDSPCTARRIDLADSCKISTSFFRLKLEWSQGVSHYNHMGAICCHGNQSSNPIWPKT